MEAFLVSTLVVAIAEIGDKTQLLAIVLAARFRRPLAITLGILVATIANHALAGLFGQFLGHLMTPGVMRWVVGLSFLSMAAWALIPDKPDDADRPLDRFGPFVATLVAFFLVEIGDKTQIATVALAARFPSVVAVVIGTTLGMMAANVPAVLFGDFAAGRLPMKAIRAAAAAIFAGLGVFTLLGFAV
ncbi:MAG: TMEM165/GDT1 family protein [Alphaproteobacteria bacterium]|nr:TMEM165/GDT1 family protein [Alphaproteobacteria bacterium]